MNDGWNSNNCNIYSYETLFPFEFRYPELTALVDTVEYFWRFKPEIRDKAITLYAFELKISSLHLYAIAAHIKQMEVGCYDF